MFLPRVRLAGVTVTVFTAERTVTVQLPLTPLPSWAVAVMVAVPIFLPVTLPVASTVATVSSLDVQVSALLVASSGLTVAVMALLSPT